jgi:hypothetical protein
MKVITSACPRCHKFYTDEFRPEKYQKALAERLMFRRLVGVQCPNCHRWLLGTIEEDDK